jgi:omega-amidase
MNTRKVTLVQSDIHWEQPQNNLNHYEQLLHDTVLTDIIVLPEMFTSGFSTRPSKHIINFFPVAVEWMMQLAMEKDAAVCGSMIVSEQNKLLNRFYFVTPPGEVFWYDKKHLFTMGGENDMFSSGNMQITISFRGVKIRPLICYDLRFPIWSRNRFDRQKKQYDYDLLIYVANWPSRRIQHWKKLLVARAIENQAYVCGVNRTGLDSNNIEYLGGSMFVGPMGELIHEATDHQQEVFTAELSLFELNEIRTKLPFAADWDSFILQ